MVLLFGGTTEGKKVMNYFDTHQVPYIYSTKTKIDFKNNSLSRYRHGALDASNLKELIKKEEITSIVNASHPFAQELHSMVHQVADDVSVPVIRFARKPLSIPSNKNIHWVSNFNEALTLMLRKYQGKRLLSLSGVQTIEKLKPWWENQFALFRILPRDSSREIAYKSKFPQEHLLYGWPSENIMSEINLIKKHDIDLVLTKESGQSGFLQTKIDAALSCEIPIIIIQQPKFPTPKVTVYSEEELSHLSF
ncbi:precorrin-6A reductase [Flammeovirga pacifica]|uniref:Precorrin-6x reductase n=1 Tax=Flammeovirga pacifica TaxID=915059 RepID=A0A1S1YYA8_FLAPC|nr:precorrin-6A reductase [Flammeovirga pacifica]OHX65865.1 precorrin-6x reductase [Flammeovirga pacifica]